jgi:hypothetical protein
VAGDGERAGGADGATERGVAEVSGGTETVVVGDGALCDEEGGAVGDEKDVDRI